MRSARNSYGTLLPVSALLLLIVACGSSGSRSTGGSGGKVVDSGGSTASGGTSGSSSPSSTGGSTPATGGNSGTGGPVAGSSGGATGGATSAGGSIQSSSGGTTGGTSGGGGTVSTSGAPGGRSGGRTGGAGGLTSGSGGTTPVVGGSGGVAGGSGGTGRGTGGGTSLGGGTGGSGGATGTGGSSKGPCDLYEAGGTPCVGAHSTTRALYGAYNGKLYQVRRADKALQDIGLLAPGGIADASVQETFCANTKCTISKIYDQSPKKNDLTLTNGGWIADRAKEVDAFGVTINLNGKTVYGIHITGETNMTGNGYRNNQAVGTAKQDEPESMYMVANGKNFNDKCCFDYGNAETNSLNNGPATMEAIYFGSCASWGIGEGKGPWVMADLEEGLFTGKNAKLNAGVKSITSDYVTAILKGKPHTMGIKAGDSQSGSLTKVYEGAYPNGYDPMKKEGAIVLGTGGDNSFAAVGDFFEGAITTGYATDDTDDAVQANIVAAGYGR
jgi:non-reducing end alpha-L-arabinofuranosidase